MSIVSSTEQAQIEAVTQEIVARLKAKLLKSVRRKEFEDILDGNFRLNDEMCTTVQQAWTCAMRLDCQLGEADRPQDERNQWLQAMAAERNELVQTKVAMESRLLCAKLDIQTAFASDGLLHAEGLACMLQENMDLRRRFSSLGRQIEDVVCSAQFRLRELGERPDARIETAASTDFGNTKRWRDEFNSIRYANDALLKALTHPDAAVAIPACALEERYDHNWRFNLELVGLLEKVMVQCQSEEGTSEAETEAKALLSELETQLPALLESKLYTQEAAARDLAQDTERAELHVRAAKKVQAQLWTFLTKSSIDLSNVVPTKFAEEMLPHPAAFGNARSKNGEDFMGGPEYPPLLRVLSYNIFMRAPAPKICHNTDDDRKDERLNRFIKHLERFDLVLLQEAFGAFSHRRDFLIKSATSIGFRDWHRSATNVFPQFLIDSGLLILSRLPIVKKASCTFQPGIHTDRLYAKGALYVKIQCGPQGPFLHVCTTHLQSTPSEGWFQESRDVRQSQLVELMSFIIENANDEPTEKRQRRRWPLLLGGDFGLNGRRSSLDGSSHSEEYCSMLSQFRTGLGDVRDLLFDVCGSHPVTYADTRLTGNGEVPVERVLTAPSAYESDFTKRQRLDYLFFFPPEVDVDLPSGSSEPLVPGTCRIEKFLVDRSRDVGAPITQLSDHYGIEATVAVISDESSPCTDVHANRTNDIIKEGSEDELAYSQSENPRSRFPSDERGGVDPAFWAAADAFASGLNPEGMFDFQAELLPEIESLQPCAAIAPEESIEDRAGKPTAFVKLAR